MELWADHLRQHERATVEESDLEKKLQGLVVPGTKQEVSHLIAVPWDADVEGQARPDVGRGKGLAGKA